MIKSEISDNSAAIPEEVMYFGGDVVRVSALVVEVVLPSACTTSLNKVSLLAALSLVAMYVNRSMLLPSALLTLME